MKKLTLILLGVACFGLALTALFARHFSPELGFIAAFLSFLGGIFVAIGAGPFNVPKNK